LWGIQAHAQESHVINEHGTYIVKPGIIMRVPFDQDMLLYKFWKNCVVLFNEKDNGITIFNVETGTLFKVSQLRRFKSFEGSNSLDFFLFDHIYRLDPDSLEIRSKEYVGQIYNNNDLDDIDWGDDIIEERIRENILRYQSKNDYIEITYGPKIHVNHVWVYYNSALKFYLIHVLTKRY
jgi:hypothetical protein